MNRSQLKVKTYGLVLLGLICMALLIHFVLSDDVVPDSPSVGVYDFTYYIVVIRDYWQGTIASPYRFDSQAASMSAFYHSQITTAMPVAVTPTALVVWLPFVWLATFSVPLANTMWLTFSLGMLFFSWQRVARYLKERHPGRLPLYGMVLYAGFCSTTMYAAVRQSQTSLLGCALLILLIVEALRVRQLGMAPRRWLFYLIFFGLSLKITYLAIAALFLFVMEFRFDAIFATLAVGVATLAVGLFCGIGLLTDYVEQLGLYSSSELPAYYISAFPLSSNSFTNVWRFILGSQFAMQLSQVVFFGGAFTILGLSYLKTRSSAKWMHIFTNDRLGLACFALFSLFISHLGAYDELVLLLAFIFVLTAETARLPSGYQFLRRLGILFTLVLLFTLLNYKDLGLTSLLWILWLFKVCFVGSLYFRLPSTSLHPVSAD